MTQPLFNALPPGTHRCPAPGCQVPVPNQMYACHADWRRLPRPVQREIYRTVGTTGTERRAATLAARYAWTRDNAERRR